MTRHARGLQSSTHVIRLSGAALAAIGFGAVVLFACADPETVPAESPVDGGGTGIQTNAAAGTEVEQQNGTCPATPTRLTGSGAEGTPCETAQDCQTVCCNCTGSQKSWLAAACISGICSPTSACSETQNDALYCQGSPGGSDNDDSWNDHDGPTNDLPGGSCSTSVPSGATYSNGTSACNTCLAENCCDSVRECNDDSSCKTYGLCMKECEEEDEYTLCSWGCSAASTSGKRIFGSINSCKNLSCSSECS